jgi:hypothetical protein
LNEIAPPRQLNRYVSMTRARTIAAFIFAPLITPLVIICSDFSRGILVEVRQVPFYFVTYGAFAYLAMIGFGIPALFLYRWLHWTNIVLFFAGGALIGLLVSIFVTGSNSIYYFLHRLAEHMLCALAGGLSASVFRLILLGFGNAGGRVPARGET